MPTIGEALVAALETRGVDHIFGIPGVHTVELYRGLAGSSIRHVTARHEQGAGFMADGYARASGKPGVAFVITGPGVTNILTPMAQARADSVPMLVISSVNKTASLGRGLGHLHELPDQQGMVAKLALRSFRVGGPSELLPALDDAFSVFASGRPGPVHIEVPTDVLKLEFEGHFLAIDGCVTPSIPDLAGANAALLDADRPVMLVGGGAKQGAEEVRRLAERLDAPVIQTVNGRGIMHGHPLCVPASPSMKAVRTLLADADLVVALGTEFGPTDFDMYQDGEAPTLKRIVRVDVCLEQLARVETEFPVCGRIEDIAPLLAVGSQSVGDGAERAEAARQAALAELRPNERAHVELLGAIRDRLPGAFLIGDSTQPVYVGNLYYDHDRAGGWFNAATGYGALGFAIPAAIGAALAEPEARVVCLCGDGGAQFSMAELMVAVDERLPVIFLIYNNRGYGEIETSMAAAGVEIVGCDPTPPDFRHIAAACGMPYFASTMEVEDVVAALGQASVTGPTLIEIAC